MAFGHPRNVGVAEQGDAVGVQFYDLRDGFFQRIGVLKWQAVNNIEIDRVDPACTQAFNNISRDLEALLAANRVLDLFVKVLHADTGAVHACAGQCI